MNWFQLALQLKSFPIKKAQRDFAEVLAIAHKDFPTYVEKQKQNIFAFHRKHNSFYNSLLTNKENLSWEELPILTKQDLQQPLESRLSKSFAVKDVYVNKTSGSSGTPFIFAKDKYAHAFTWSHIMHLYKQYEIIPNQSLEARFYGIPYDFLGKTKERAKDVMAGRFRFDVFNLNDEVLASYVELFRQKKFDYINGYTSSELQLAKYLHRNNMVLTSICPSLKLCIVTSEMLFDEDKLLMEQSFGVPVVNEYGASELDVIAFQSPLGVWEVNDKTLYVEIVDEQGRVLPFGEEGNIVITSFYNKAHPFIRYKIGDVGALEENPLNGRPILKKLIGRTNDFAVLPSGKKVPGLTFYYVTKSVIENNENVKEIKVIQHTLQKFEIEYASSAVLSNAEEKNILKAMETYLEKGLKICFTNVSELKREKSGKLKQFTSKVALV